MQSRPSMSILFAALRVVWALMPHWMQHCGSDAALECNCSLVCGRALRSGSSHGCWIESSWFSGDDYVSKALVCIILGRMWARQDVLFASLGLVSYRPLAHCIKRSSAGPRAEAN